VEIRRQNAINESEENVYELIKMTMRVLNSTEENRVSEAGIRLSAGTDCKEELAEAAGQKL
jgi:hypothetical protein